MNTTVSLNKGLTIGDVTHTVAELKEYTAGDLIDACNAAEKVVYTEAGPVLIASPIVMDMELLCRQIVRVGSHEGPLTMGELRRLSASDLTKLQIAAKSLDAGAVNMAAIRGRNDGSQESD